MLSNLDFKEIVKKLYQFIIIFVIGITSLFVIYSICDSTIYAANIIYLFLELQNKQALLVYYKSSYAFLILTISLFSIVIFLIGLIIIYSYQFFTKKNKINNLFSKITCFKTIKLIFNSILILMIIIISMILIPLFFVSVIYDRIELYENEIKIYKILQNEKFFSIKSIKYQEVQFIYLDFSARSTGRRDLDIRKSDYNIDLLVYLKAKDQDYEIVNEEVFYLEIRKQQIIKMIEIFKSKNIKIQLNKPKEDLFQLIKKYYKYESDQKRSINNLKEIFNLIN